MPLQATSGAASYDAFGGGVPVVPNYIEDVFNVWLYTGTGANQNIVNGIDLAGKGGLTWIKSRDSTVTQYTHNMLVDTVRGAYNRLISNLTNGQFTNGPVSSFNSNGFSLDTINSSIGNESGGSYVSWTFRKQPKFFDVVTYTGTQGVGGSGQAINHNLGSEPACIIIKPINDSGTNWTVYHRGLSSPFTQQLLLNSTAAVATNSNKVKAVSSTTFTAGWELAFDTVQYVAYIFAHNAGGFGLTGTDNVISCGSYTATGNDNINLGFEAQWVLHRRANTDSEWYIQDIQRGMSLTSSQQLQPNASDAEGTFTGDITSPTATGFHNGLWGSGTIIYIAIRRGPMKVPTSGTSVFAPIAYTGTGTAGQVTGANFPPDLFWVKLKKRRF